MTEGDEGIPCTHEAELLVAVQLTLGEVSPHLAEILVLGKMREGALSRKDDYSSAELAQVRLFLRRQMEKTLPMGFGPRPGVRGRGRCCPG